ncbi:dihydrofolate reductase [Sphingomonas oleivorans]|uniref:Dihydrofolate reductase n=1 Tax=Sphingomonas oleivorans TaxID=1735121 RepID=A0A2T5FVI6_9SPHN|nr:2-hydroxyacid dehydrogenase [Sphingomonas oleivorans]PTQ09785.1 dihydrofolate reductase [Sphingomonas oleivorans]
MRPEILLVADSSPWLDQGLTEGYEVHRLSEADQPEALLAEIAPRIRALVTSGAKGASNALIDALPALGLIAVHGVGLDRIDLAHARARGIAVTTTPDVLTDDVADMALALVLALSRRIAANDRHVRAGRWEAGMPVPLGRSATGRRYGIIGLGQIGSAIAKRLRPLAGEIAYHNRRPLPASNYHYHDSAVGLAEAVDTLILAASSKAGEPPIVDQAVLDALGPDGLFVNIARGAAVDEEALVAALRESRIAGAALDVFADEPRMTHELWSLDTVVLQPHQGSATRETRIAMADLLLANLAAFFAGEALVTPV